MEIKSKLHVSDKNERSVLRRAFIKSDFVNLNHFGIKWLGHLKLLPGPKATTAICFLQSLSILKDKLC